MQTILSSKEFSSLNNVAKNRAENNVEIAENTAEIPAYDSLHPGAGDPSVVIH